MKKSGIYFIVFIMLVSLFAGCGKQEHEPEQKHEHVAVSEWDRDVDSHWRLCDCGEKMDIAQHVLEYNTCTVCGTIIGSVYLSNKNEHGDIVRQSYFAMDDPSCLDEEFVTEYEYDEAGNYIQAIHYHNGQLSLIELYTTNSLGNYVCNSIYFRVNGYEVTDYDEQSRTIRSRIFGNIWNPLADIQYQYEISEYGRYYVSCETNYYPYRGQSIVTAYNERGDALWQKFYEGHTLREEREYVYVPDTDDSGSGTRLCSKQTVYEEDGSYIVYDYEVTVYDDGNYDSGFKMYEYNQNGELIACRDTLG